MDDFRRILVSRLRFMGDVILTTPLVRALRKNFPQAHLAYLTEKTYASLLLHNPHLDEIIPFDREGFAKSNPIISAWAQARFFHDLRKKHFQVGIDLLGIPRSALLLWVSGAPCRIGGDFRLRRHLYTKRIKDDGQKKSAIEFHLQSLKALGLSEDGYRTEVFTTAAEEAWAQSYLREKGLDQSWPIIGLHTGATWPAKMWLWERFAELALRMRQELGARVILTQGPGEAELVAEIAAAVGDGIVTCELLNLRQLAALLKQLDLYVSNDCGPMHLAVAVGTKTIGIFGPSEPDIWFPYDRQNGHVAIHKNLPCHPCHQDFCEIMECMKEIQVGDVFASVGELLTSIQSSG